jgi:hypothetical protein
MDLDLTIQGAPNFRAPDEEGLNVYGVAQPTVAGLKSILTILRCQPSGRSDIRRGSTTLVNTSSNGAPLVKSTSQPLDGKSRSDEAGEQEEGKVIWFSTREETLSKW